MPGSLADRSVAGSSLYLLQRWRVPLCSVVRSPWVLIVSSLMADLSHRQPSGHPSRRTWAWVHSPCPWALGPEPLVPGPGPWAPGLGPWGPGTWAPGPGPRAPDPAPGFKAYTTVESRGSIEPNREAITAGKKWKPKVYGYYDTFVYIYVYYTGEKPPMRRCCRPLLECY